MKAGSRIINELTNTEIISTAATARLCATLVLQKIVTERPAIVLIRSGRKQITRGPRTICLNAGEAVMVPTALAFDLMNTPIGGQFITTMINPAQYIIDTVAEDFGDVPGIRDAQPIRDIEPDLLSSFDRAVFSQLEHSQVPQKVAENRVQEVLIWLAHKGYKFGNDRNANLTQRVRTIVCQDLGRAWKAREVADLVAMSEATLRRRLAQQGLSFQQVLIDIRMTRAVALLQVTDLAIGQIAINVGYDSPSRFAARFKTRFGFPPSAVRADN